jgi:hypothetical protein
VREERQGVEGQEPVGTESNQGLSDHDGRLLNNANYMLLHSISGAKPATEGLWSHESHDAPLMAIVGL